MIRLLLCFAMMYLLTACRPGLNKLNCRNIYDIGLTDKKKGHTYSVSIDAGDKEGLSKFCDAFKLSKEIAKPTISDDEGYYELNIWFVDRSYFDIQIIFTKHDGVVIQNGDEYYRNDELVALAERMFKRLHVTEVETWPKRNVYV
jgi:hypothetical protein